MRKKYVIANWKMNPCSLIQATGLGKLIKDFASKNKLEASVVIAPPAVFLAGLAEIFQNTKLSLAGQDIFWQQEGPFTGQVSALMLKSLGVEFVILGHSEVRQENGDTDQEINKKVKIALENKITPIICLGEKSQGGLQKALKSQFERILFGIKDIEKVVLCYEPVWAISKGSLNHKSATPQEAQKAHVFLRKLLVEKYGAAIAESVSIIYGGSVSPKNASELFEQLDIDGGLVGAASLSIRKFSKILKSF